MPTMPSGGPPPLPPYPPAVDLSNARLHKAVSDAGGKIVNAGVKLEQLAARFDTFHQELALLRGQLLGDITPPFSLRRPPGNPAPITPPTPANDATEPAPSSVRAAAGTAGKAALRGSKWLLMTIGALGVAVQIASAYRPGLVAPIQTLVDLLSQFAN